MSKASRRGDKGGGGGGSGSASGGPLQEALRRYEAGDQVGARREARQVLAASPGHPEAEGLIARTRPPIWAWPYALGAAVVLALMLALAIARGQG